MSWLKNILPSVVFTENKKQVPDGVWTQCKSCEALIYKIEFEKNLFVCHKCDHHHRISARDRLTMFLDQGSMTEVAADIEGKDWLKFKDSKKYKDRISTAKKQTGENEAMLVMQGDLHNMSVIAASFDFFFIGGSMGHGVGEKFVQGVEMACKNKLPFICFCSSGGARMQEGLISLMQMAKTSAALTKLDELQLPYIVVLTDPTTGGVSASLAMLGDVIIAEPKALIGFAGQRVIEQTVREVLPEGFQRSEFLLEHGAIDMIVARSDLRDKIYGLLAKIMNPSGS